MKVGDELARITSPDFGQAQADAVKSEADLALAKRVLERTRELLKQGVLPQKELDTAENAFDDAQSERDRAVERLAVWGGRGGDVNGAFALKAPMGGVIVDRNVQPGQEVRSDQMLAGLSLIHILLRRWPQTLSWVSMPSWGRSLPAPTGSR